MVEAPGTLTVFFQLPFVAGIFSLLLAGVSIVRTKPSPATWSFFAGMTALGIDSVLTGFALQATRVDDVIRWMTASSFIKCFIPVIWLCFGLTYSRSGYREFLDRWRPVLLLVGLAIIAGPVLVFIPKLRSTRLNGLADYMAMAEDYVGQFDRKWVRTKPHSEPILGTPDIQSLADLSNSVQIVLKMRLAPVNARMVTSTVGAVVLPMLPLLLFQFPLTEIAKKLVTGLVGL